MVFKFMIWILVAVFLYSFLLFFCVFQQVKELYRLKNGDEVLLPACTWVTNVAPIIQLGLKPVFVDINLKDFSFDINKVKRIAKNHNIKMVFTTHLLGFPFDVNKLRNIFPKALDLLYFCGITRSIFVVKISIPENTRSNFLGNITMCL